MARLHVLRGAWWSAQEDWEELLDKVCSARPRTSFRCRMLCPERCAPFRRTAGGGCFLPPPALTSILLDKCWRISNLPPGTHRVLVKR